MLRIGVLADTHIFCASEGERLLQQLTAHHFADVDLVLHAGDLVDPELLSSFNMPVYAVRGNLDPPAPQLPPLRILDIAGFRFGARQQNLWKYSGSGNFPSS